MSNVIVKATHYYFSPQLMGNYSINKIYLK